MKSMLGTQVSHGAGELLRLTCAPRDAEDQVTAGNLAHLMSVVLLTPPDEDFLAVASRQRPMPGLRLTTRALMSELALLAGGASLPTYQAEYARLFLTGDRVPCTPLESAWRRGDRSVRRELLRIYAESGFRMAKLAGEPPDHLGVEAAFLAHLNAAIIEGTQDEEAYERFWDRHVASWVPSFADCLRRSARIRFYRTIGQILLALTLPEKD